MSLTDPDILELTTLCNAVIDETITDDQKARLSYWLSTSDDARRFYVRFVGQSASLFSYAAEMQTGARDAAPAPKAKRWRWVVGLAVAATTAVAAAIALTSRLSVSHPPSPAPVTPVVATAAPAEEEFVGRL